MSRALETSGEALDYWQQRKKDTFQHSGMTIYAGRRQGMAGGDKWEAYLVYVCVARFHRRFEVLAGEDVASSLLHGRPVNLRTL